LNINRGIANRKMKGTAGQMPKVSKVGRGEDRRGRSGITALRSTAFEERFA